MNFIEKLLGIRMIPNKPECLICGSKDVKTIYDYWINPNIRKHIWFCNEHGKIKVLSNEWDIFSLSRVGTYSSYHIRLGGELNG